MQLVTVRPATLTARAITAGQVSADALRCVFLLALLPFLPLILLMPKGEARASEYDRKSEAEHDEAARFHAYCNGDKL